MSSEEIAVRVANLSKLYEIYHRPLDRLKQSIYPRIVGKYLRLLYAPDDRRNGIREEIRSLPWNSNRPESITLPRAQAEAPSYGIHAAEAEIEEFFDPNLVPQSTLAYESQGAHIESPKIFTLAGDRVNCLKRGKTYRYRYKVRFDKAAANVRFGMLINHVRSGTGRCYVRALGRPDSFLRRARFIGPRGIPFCLRAQSGHVFSQFRRARDHGSRRKFSSSRAGRLHVPGLAFWPVTSQRRGRFQRDPGNHRGGQYGWKGIGGTMTRERIFQWFQRSRKGLSDVR
jgi:hypothetical protein